MYNFIQYHHDQVGRIYIPIALIMSFVDELSGYLDPSLEDEVQIWDSAS